MGNVTYQRRKDAGLCTRCGSPATPGRTTCQGCRDKAKETASALYNSRKSEGLCVLCGGPARPELATCQACADCYSERQKASRAHRRKNNLCIYCGKPARHGYVTCPECGDKKAEESRERYVQAKKKGNCAGCGKPALPGMVLCQECKDKNNEAVRGRRAFLKEHGTCVQCGNSPAMMGNLCSRCAEKNTIYKPRTDEQKAEINRRARQRYKQRKANGLCVVCGKHPATDGHIDCMRCRTTAAQRRAERHISGVEGICRSRDCDNPVVEGKKYCAECLPAMQERMHYVRSFVDRKNHTWVRDTRVQIEMIKARAAGKRNNTKRCDRP